MRLTGGETSQKGGGRREIGQRLPTRGKQGKKLDDSTRNLGPGGGTVKFEPRSVRNARLGPATAQSPKGQEVRSSRRTGVLPGINTKAKGEIADRERTQMRQLTVSVWPSRSGIRKQNELGPYGERKGGSADKEGTLESTDRRIVRKPGESKKCRSLSQECTGGVTGKAGAWKRSEDDSAKVPQKRKKEDAVYHCEPSVEERNTPHNNGRSKEISSTKSGAQNRRKHPSAGWEAWARGK